MDKVKEIEECLAKIIYDEKDYGGKRLLKDGTAWLAYGELLRNSELWLRTLLSYIKELEKSLTIKILENAKGAQVLSNTEERIKELEELATKQDEMLDVVATRINNTEARMKKLEEGIVAVNNLICQSSGVDGLHLNGDTAPWDELRTEGVYHEWLIDFDKALKLVEEKR